jgi:hypothetical protein
VEAQVTRTCGASGNGDCYLSLRAAPRSTSRELGRRDEGSGIVVVCQVQGQAVTSSALGATSDLWSRTEDGAYVASAYLQAPGLDPFRQTLPPCS